MIVYFEIDTSEDREYGPVVWEFRWPNSYLNCMKLFTYSAEMFKRIILFKLDRK